MSLKSHENGFSLQLINDKFSIQNPFQYFIFIQKELKDFQEKNKFKHFRTDKLNKYFTINQF